MVSSSNSDLLENGPFPLHDDLVFDERSINFIFGEPLRIANQFETFELSTSLCHLVLDPLIDIHDALKRL